MSTTTSSETRTVSVELPAGLAEKAEQCGLLAPAEIERLLEAELRRLAREELGTLQDALHALPPPAFTEDDVIRWSREAKAKVAADRARGR